MKKVLFIAYYFPPMGMGGVQRAAKFVKYLPEFGWDPVVLTVKDVSYHAGDNTLLEEVEKAVIYRTGSLDPLRLHWKFFGQKASSDRQQSGSSAHSGLLNRINAAFLSKLFIPDSKILWLPHAVLRSGKIIRKIKPDLIFTTSPPHSVHCIGRALKKKYHIPWIMDFRDHLFNEMFQTDMPVWRRRNSEGLYRKISGSADKILTVSAPIAGRLADLAKNKNVDFHVLPNGFDRSDFTGLRQTKKNKKFTIGYCGTFNNYLNPGCLLKALQQVIQRIPDIEKRMQFVFTGQVTDIQMQKNIDETGLSGLFKSTGYVSHKRSIQYMLDADLLFFLLPWNADPGMVTGKIYEYLASGKPILAEVPEGDAADLLKIYGKNTIVAPGNEKILTDEIIRLYQLWEKGRLKTSMSYDKRLNRFDRRNQCEELAGLFDSVCKKTSR